jgi:hypothetical protein
VANVPFPCFGYLVHPFEEEKRTTIFTLDSIDNFLQAYASNFTFLNVYASNLTKSSTFSCGILSVKRTSYCNFMRPARCKEMGIITSHAALPFSLQLVQVYPSNFFLQIYTSGI